MKRLSEAVRGRLAETGEEATAGRVAAALRAEERLLGDSEVLVMADELRAEFVGAGPLDPLLREPEVTDVLVNGPDEVWVDAGAGLVRTSVRFPDETALRRLAQRLTAAAGRRLDDAAPYADARLPGGVRLHAVLPPIAANGTCLSLRLPRRRAFTLDELVAAGSIPPEGACLLAALIEARAAFLVSGGTGTGKTTMLSCMLSLAHHGERLVLVEDSAELRPDHPHVIRLEARPPNVEGAGGVTLHDLVRQALRMRPDRLVVGEVRGNEVTILLSALNTGHEGGCGTLHANRAADVPARLEALACAAGLTREAVHSQLAAALDVIIHLVRGPGGGSRRVSEICLLERAADGLVGVLPAVSFTATGDMVAAPGAEALAARLGHTWKPSGPHRPQATSRPLHRTSRTAAGRQDEADRHTDQQTYEHTGRPHPAPEPPPAGERGHLDQARFGPPQAAPNSFDRAPLTADRLREDRRDPPGSDRLSPPP